MKGRIVVYSEKDEILINEVFDDIDFKYTRGLCYSYGDFGKVSEQVPDGSSELYINALNFKKYRTVEEYHNAMMKEK